MDTNIIIILACFLITIVELFILRKFLKPAGKVIWLAVSTGAVISNIILAVVVIYFVL